MAQLLLASKADVNAKSKAGETPLFISAEGWHHENDKDMAELLLANRADVHAKDNVGETPLHIAARWDRKDMVELLLTNKADVNALTVSANLTDQTGGHVETLGNLTPLHMAELYGAKNAAESLRQHGGHE